MVDKTPRLKRYKNPYFLFFPFLILYIVLIIIFSDRGYIGDENRYIMFAENLINGHYSPKEPFIDLGNGPGYPLILVPFVGLGIPFIYTKLLNGVFYYFSLIFLFKSLNLVVNNKLSIIFSFFWGFYPLFFEQMVFSIPEVLSASLFPILIYTIIRTHKIQSIKQSIKYIIISGLIIGYLALVKPIFGYVIMSLILGTAVLLIHNRKSISHKKSLYILSVALLTTLPYLIYTYNVTGKIFYWSSFGGNNLYWMSTPYENEYGDWMEFPANEDNHRVTDSYNQINLNHQSDFDQLLKNEKVRIANTKDGKIQYNLTKGIVQDDMLKAIAIENIKKYPIKFLKNCISNTGRILFHYPFSYTIQKPGTLGRLPFNGIILVFSLFCGIISIIRWRALIYPIRFLLFIILIYFGGTILGSAENRMFFLMVPVLLVWIAYIISKSIRIDLKWQTQNG